MSNSKYLPLKFESKESCEAQRRLVEKAVYLLKEQTETSISFSSSCDAGSRCQSGLCPVCCHILRKKLLRFVRKQKWHKQTWLFVTVFVDGWTIEAGDLRQFGDLRDHKSIKNLKQHFRRLNIPNLRIFGSIETVFKTVGNEPHSKPFHLHLMVSGLDKATVIACIRKALKVNTLVAVPIKVEPVKPTPLDFNRAASYAFKLPFWKQSYLRLNNSTSRKQFPKTSELAELVSNLGVHTSSERLIMMGMRFHGGRFKLIPR